MIGAITPGPAYLLVTGVVIVGLVVIRIAAAGRAWMRGTLRVTAAAERGLIALLLLSMVALSLLQIVLRNLFSTGLIWIDPLLRHEVLWIGFLAAALATADDRHINIDVLSRLLRGVTQRGVHALVRLLAACVTLALSNAAYGLLVDEHHAQTEGFLSIPVWALMSIMPIALALMSYRFLVSAWRGRRAP